MSEQPMPGGGPADEPASTCPWCSAPLPEPIPERCPACLAALIAAPTEVPGLTRVDHEGLLRQRAAARRSRGLIGWLSREDQDAAPAVAPESLAPPADEVRREMFRLELAALEAEIQAREVEATALAAVFGDPTSDRPDPAGDAAETRPMEAGDDGPAMDGTTGEEPREG